MPVKVIIDGKNSSKHWLRGTWSNMRSRCYYPKNKDYKFYGARGIKICDRWDIFENFVEDIKRLGPRPKNFTLDRIDSNKDYGPDNVRWASKSKQVRNQNMRKQNKSGAIGVNRVTGCQGFIARITHNGERIYLGYFKKLEDAIQARIDAEKRFKWHDIK